MFNMTGELCPVTFGSLPSEAEGMESCGLVSGSCLCLGEACPKGTP